MRTVYFSVVLLSVSIHVPAAAQEGAEAMFTEPPIIQPGAVSCALPGFLLCGSMCVDPSTHEHHCGACGVTCAEDQQCVQGQCVSDRWNIPFGGEVGLGLGGGGPLSDTTNAFFDDLTFEGGSGMTTLPWGAPEPFGGGLRLKVEGGLVTRGIGFGLRYRNASASASTSFSGLDVSFDAWSLGAYLRGSLARFPIGPLDGNVYMDGAIAYQTFSQLSDGQVALSAEGAQFAGTLGMDVSIIEGLRAGLAFGIFADLATGYSSEVYQISEASIGAPAVGWSFEVTSRYVLPFSREPQTFVETAAVVRPEQRIPRQILALVQAQFDVQRAQDEAQITQTERYRARRANYRRVAVAAPTGCVNQNVAQTTGQTQAAGDILRTSCGVEMAELERALAQAGYIVTSWRTMNQSQSLPLEAARTFHADVLFQVNSLENSAIPLAQANISSWRYFRADAQGNQQQPLPLSRPDQQQLLQLAASPLSIYQNQTRFASVTLDSTAIDVETGETVWLYRHSKVEVPSGTDRFTSLARGVELLGPRQPGQPYLAWTPYRAQQASTGPQQVVDEFSTGTSSMSETGSTATNPYQEHQHRMLREVVADFVQKFQTGEGGAR